MRILVTYYQKCWWYSNSIDHDDSNRFKVFFGTQTKLAVILRGKGNGFKAERQIYDERVDVHTTQRANRHTIQYSLG